MFVNDDLTFNRAAIFTEAWRRTKAKGRFAAAHGGFGRFLRDAWAQAKAVRADRASGGPERRAREAAEKEARYAAFLKSRTAADLARSDELVGLLCSTDGRLGADARARLHSLQGSSSCPL